MVVMHIITGLNDGGAEAVLYRLCKHDTHNIHRVVALGGFDKYGAILEGLGVEVTALNMSRKLPPVVGFYRLVKLLRFERPDVVQTWMYHGDLVGGLAARVAGIKTIFWGIRQSTLEPGSSKRMTMLVVKWLAKLSRRVPVKVIVCAQRAIDVHRSLGFSESKLTYIPNGYDLTEFQPITKGTGDLEARFVPDVPIPTIGMIGRFDPQKDHANLLDTLSILRNRDIAIYCLLIGRGLDQSNPEIVDAIVARGLADSVQLLGQRSDIPEIMNSLDLHVLSSAYGEGFPNVVAEAMACGTPCVVTDVGDAGEIVGDTGWIVPPRNPDALADAIEAALKEVGGPDWSNRCKRARARIVGRYSIENMVAAYQAVWSASLCKDASG